MLFTFGLACLLGCDQPHPPPAAPQSAAATQPAMVVAEPAISARWDVRKKVNELDGKAAITLVADSMIVRCGAKFEGYVRPPLTNLGGRLETTAEHQQSVRFRLDDGPLRTQAWAVSDSFDSLFIPTQTLRKMLGAKKLTYEYDPEYTTKETASVDLTGLAEAMKLAGCKL